MGGHGYAIHVETRQVWNYTAEEFVDRLIENDADRKLISKGRGLDIEMQFHHAMKLQNLNTEYTTLLQDETKKQRKIYEHMIMKQRARFKRRREKVQREIESREDYVDKAPKNYDNDLKSYEDQISEASTNNEKLGEMIRVMRKQKRGWAVEVRKLEAEHQNGVDEIRSRCAYELSDLAAQLRDLKTHLK